MGIANYIYLAIFISTIIYLLYRYADAFKIKLIASIPVLLLLAYFSHSFIVLPIFIFSMFLGTYLYTVFFYFPFAVDFVLIVIATAGKLIPLRFIFASISMAILISMFLDKNMKKYDLMNKESKGKDIKIETNRDYFQIAAGIVTLLIFLIAGLQGRIIVLITVFLIYLVGNILYLNNKNRIAVMVYSMERDNTKLGLGSMYLAAGFLLILAFVRSMPVIYISIFILMIGDSLATIIGMNMHSPKLFYNHKKSVAGFLAMLIPSMLFGFIDLAFIVSFVYATGATFAESISNRVADDNITIPVAIVIVHFLIIAL
ncbi:MAG: hypothetical protein QXZ44_04845 [Ferroplasma sp.]